MSLRHLEANYQPARVSGPTQVLFPQFEDIDQQNESYVVGMWTFLVTEIMFFGALFLAYSVYRTLYPQTFFDAHEFLDPVWGTVNTFILLTSSFTMVMAVYYHQHSKKWNVIAMLALTILLSFGFLGVKYIEYSKKIGEGLYPGWGWDYSKALAHHAAEHGGGHGGATHDAKEHSPTVPGSASGEPGARYEPNTEGINTGENVGFLNPKEGFNTSVATIDTNEINIGHATLSADATREEVRSRRAKLFFCIYFIMTGLHGVHVLIGILLMGTVIIMLLQNHHLIQDYMPTEMIGLYWHFVDIVWIFLFPMMYLIS